jgi:hypothetical protein
MGGLALLFRWAESISNALIFSIFFTTAVRHLYLSLRRNFASVNPRHGDEPAT